MKAHKIQNNRLTWISVLVFINLIFSFAVFAGGVEPSANRFSDWNVVGPIGGDVRAMAIDPRDEKKMYFTSLDGQVYSSNDAGKNWSMLANFDHPQLILDNIMVDVRDSKTIYASGHRHKEPGGFFKTTDGGATWRESQALNKEPLHAMTQSTLDPNMLLVGGVNGVFMTLDAGETWRKLNTSNIVGVIIDSLAVDPKDTNILYAGTTWRPYKSIDKGATWKLTADGMIGDSDIFTIEIDPDKPEHIIAAACSGMYETQNAMANWKKIGNIPSTSRRSRAFATNPAKPEYKYVGTTEGFWMSTDSGASWSITTSKQIEINAIVISPTEPNKVYLGTNNYGVMLSTDYGKNFSMTNGGFSTRLTYSIVADRENPKRLYATTINTATGGGFIFLSTDGGLTWKDSMKNYPYLTIPYSILQDEQNANTIYAGTGNGLYRSIDRGVSWAQVIGGKAVAPKSGTTKKTVSKKTAVAKTPVKPAVRIATLTDKVNNLTYTNDGKNGMLAGTSKGLYRSYNLAAGWERLPFPSGFDTNVQKVLTSALNPSVIWVGTASSGLIVSRDSGITWQKASGVPEGVPISSMAIDPTNENRVFVGTKQTLYMTQDGGATWIRRGGNLPIGDFSSIVINPKSPNEVFAGSSWDGNGGIYQSLDGGMNWTRLDAKEWNLPSRRIWSIAFDPKDPNRLFVGTHSSGIYRIERGVESAAVEGRPRTVGSTPNEK